MLGGAVFRRGGMSQNDVQIVPLPNSLPTRLPLFTADGQPLDLLAIPDPHQRAMVNMMVERAWAVNYQAKWMEAISN